MRAWLRNASNDTFYFGSLDLARHLSRATGLEVVLGFIEFTSPGLEEAIEQAVQPGTERVIVVTPMMTLGGEHAERDIPRAIRGARQRYPGVEVTYAWPFDGRQVAQFLAAHINKLPKWRWLMQPEPIERQVAGRSAQLVSFAPRVCVYA